MKAGNQDYLSPRDLPAVIPVFPLAGALLLPRGQMPLNIFEPRYLAMIDEAIAGARVIGMIQPEGDETSTVGRPPLRAIGCAGRITGFSETGDGRYLVTLTGISRFRTIEEVPGRRPFRCFRVTAEPFAADFVVSAGENEVDRETLLDAFRAYLEAHNLEADWDSVDSASNEALVNAIAMISPYGPAEKQALLEAPDLKTRAETLVALTEVSLARDAGASHTLQ
jgi:Lon protease-like protein